MSVLSDEMCVSGFEDSRTDSTRQHICTVSRRDSGAGDVHQSLLSPSSARNMSSPDSVLRPSSSGSSLLTPPALREPGPAPFFLFALTSARGPPDATLLSSASKPAPSRKARRGSTRPCARAAPPMRCIGLTSSGVESIADRKLVSPSWPRRAIESASESVLSPSSSSAGLVGYVASSMTWSSSESEETSVRAHAVAPSSPSTPSLSSSRICS